MECNIIGISIIAVQLVIKSGSPQILKELNVFNRACRWIVLSIVLLSGGVFVCVYHRLP